MKSQKIVDGIRYNFEVFMMNPLEGVYRFGLQIFSGDKILPFSIRLSEEFIEDEIDNNKEKNYLEKVAIRAVDNHLQDVISLNQRVVAANLPYWFKEAKQQIEKMGKQEK